MRRVADQLNIRALSLYTHFPDKEALEVAIIVDGFEEAAAKFEAAEADTADPWATFAATYRDFVMSHPHVYRLITERPLAREQLPAGLEARTAAPLLRATGDPARARAAWAFLYGAHHARAQQPASIRRPHRASPADRDPTVPTDTSQEPG